MPKIRIYELAKKLNKTNKELLTILEDKGITKKFNSSLEESEEKLIKDHFVPKETKETPKPVQRQTPDQNRQNQGQNLGQSQGQSQSPSQNQGQGQGQNQGFGQQRQDRQNGFRNNQHNNRQGSGERRPNDRAVPNSNFRPNQGERKPFQDRGSYQNNQDRNPQDRNNQDRGNFNRPQGERSFDNQNRYQGNRSQDSRYQGNRYQGNGNRPYGEQQDRQADSAAQAKPQDGTQQTSQPTQGTQQSAQGRPYQSRPYQNKPYQNRPAGEKGGFGDNRKPFTQSKDRPPFERRDNKPAGDKPFGDRPYGDRRPGGGTGERREGGGSYGDRQNRPFGDKKPFQDKKFGPAIPAAPKVEKPFSEKREKIINEKRERSVIEKPEKPFIKNDELKIDLKDSKLKPKAKQDKQKQTNNKKEQPEAAKPKTTPVEEAAVATNVEDEIKTIKLPKSITVKEFSERINQPSIEIIKLLMKRGIIAALNQEIDFYTATQIAEGFDIITAEEEEEDLLAMAFPVTEDRPQDMQERPPVVVVMGHVDHGKTSLLDCIRNSSVQTTEAGGITQHIGAYQVSLDGKNITFLDTPGHEAFTAMRMRGAQVTDIAVLVVAADDGVMPQTIEAINHAKAANVEIIVAINKIDKPSANPDRVKQELAEYGLLVEDWGGETICVHVSAINKTGIDTLLEMINLAAQMKELKANPNKSARGTVIEALLDKGRGPVATVLVKDGTLNIGDPLVCGGTFGRIRAMLDHKGNKVKVATPSTPVEILGLSGVPLAGDLFFVAQNEKYARQVAESIIAKGRLELIKDTPSKVSLDDLFNQIQAGNVKDLNIVVKGDVQGSVEAVKSSLERLTNDAVRVRILHGGVGAITESDVMLASASNAIIIGFNVRPDATARAVADTEKVDVRLYRIIYNAIEDISAAMKGMLDPEFAEKVIGHGEIRQLFKASGVGTIGGSYVTEGKFQRNAKFRIVRNGKVVYDGTLDTLKRFKDDVKEVAAGYECGLLFTKFNDIKEGDSVEAYIMEEIPRK